jgi:hypothetical protein
MKKIQLIILIFNTLFLLSCVSNPATIPQRNKITLPPIPSTLHAVIVADTNDNKIGNSTEVDFKNINNLVQDISLNTGMILSKRTLKSHNLQSNNIRTILNNLAIKRNDAVVFYYAGHGKNPLTGTKWPSMMLYDENLELNFVINKLKQKNPRFFLVIADSCNDFPNNRGYPITQRGIFSSSFKKQNYQNLFLKTRGYIVTSAAKPGQLSWSYAQTGGLFTNQFLDSFYNTITYSNQANWHSIMQSAVKTIKLPNNLIQQPQYEIGLK